MHHNRVIIALFAT